jgi:hypothetical protein
MRQLLRPGSHVLIEVPDFGAMLAAPDYSVLWEEHANFFTRDTLVQYLASAGIEVVHAETVTFSGQTLVVVGRYTGASATRITQRVVEECEAARAYAEKWPRFRDELVEYLADARREGRRIVMYGGGVRAACLVNYAGLAPYLDLVVDDETAKQGKLMPGSGLAIEPSDALGNAEGALCLLAVNAENEERVIAKHDVFARDGGEFASLHPPSPRLPAFWRRYADDTAAAADRVA